MDCKIFRKRLMDFVEDNLSYDLKDAILLHIAECEFCRAIYDEELSIDITIKKGLSIDTKVFKSLRTDIIKSIDKNKYGISPMKNLMNHLRKHMITYTYIAAVAAVAILITPFIGRMDLSFDVKKSISVPQAPIVANSEGNFSNSMSLKKAHTDVQAKSKTDEGTQYGILATESISNYFAAFEKTILDKNYRPNFNTVWINSSNKRYTATLEGRGTSAKDDGVATIVIKEVVTEKQWALRLLNNETQQMSPRSIYWVDDQRLLVIVGLAQGHASQGGNLYLLNINTAETTNANPENTANLENGSVITKVVSTKVLENSQLEITVEISVYDDSIQNKYHIENRIIVIKE